MEQVKKQSFSGSRKTARATISIVDSGYLVNKKDIRSYFSDQKLIDRALSPLILSDLKCGFKVNVKGSGSSAQSWAIRYTLSKIIALNYPEFKERLNKAGFLKGDDRGAPERKKLGKYKARKSHTYRRR